MQQQKTNCKCAVSAYEANNFFKTKIYLFFQVKDHQSVVEGILFLQSKSNKTKIFWLANTTERLHIKNLQYIRYLYVRVLYMCTLKTALFVFNSEVNKYSVLFFVNFLYTCGQWNDLHTKLLCTRKKCNQTFTDDLECFVKTLLKSLCSRQTL